MARRADLAQTSASRMTKKPRKSGNARYEREKETLSLRLQARWDVTPESAIAPLQSAEYSTRKLSRLILENLVLLSEIMTLESGRRYLRKVIDSRMFDPEKAERRSRQRKLIPEDIRGALRLAAEEGLADSGDGEGRSEGQGRDGEAEQSQEDNEEEREVEDDSRRKGASHSGHRQSKELANTRTFESAMPQKRKLRVNDTPTTGSSKRSRASQRDSPDRKRNDGPASDHTDDESSEESQIDSADGEQSEDSSDIERARHRQPPLSDDGETRLEDDDLGFQDDHSACASTKPIPSKSNETDYTTLSAVEAAAPSSTEVANPLYLLRENASNLSPARSVAKSNQLTSFVACVPKASTKSPRTLASTKPTTYTAAVTGTDPAASLRKHFTAMKANNDTHQAYTNNLSTNTAAAVAGPTMPPTPSVTSPAVNVPSSNVSFITAIQITGGSDMNIRAIIPNRTSNVKRPVENSAAKSYESDEASNAVGSRPVKDTINTSMTPSVTGPTLDTVNSLRNAKANTRPLETLAAEPPTQSTVNECDPASTPKIDPKPVTDIVSTATVIFDSQIALHQHQIRALTQKISTLTTALHKATTHLSILTAHLANLSTTLKTLKNDHSTRATRLAADASIYDRLLASDSQKATDPGLALILAQISPHRRNERGKQEKAEREMRRVEGEVRQVRGEIESVRRGLRGEEEKAEVLRGEVRVEEGAVEALRALRMVVERGVEGYVGGFGVGREVEEAGEGRNKPEVGKESVEEGAVEGESGVESIDE